jgi:hypothetical protein
MRGTSAEMRARLAWGAIAAQVLFTLGWLALGVIEGHGYSAISDDISDLSSLTAHAAGIMRVVCGVSGALTIAFAIWALRPALAIPGRRTPISAWLVAASLPALDNLSDAFFRLDCRAADAGCPASVAAASWHGTMHVVVGTVAGLATIAAPFALSFRMRKIEAWRDLARPALVLGGVVVLGVLAYSALEGSGGGGWTQRLLAVIVCSGIVVLAVRVLRLARAEAVAPELPSSAVDAT